MSRDFKYLRMNSDNALILEVLLARQPVNAVDVDMYIEIAALFSQPDRFAPKARVIVLRGDGPHFCAGNDLDEFATMTPENGTERMWRVREAFFAIQDCPLPVIGATHGAVLGTGLAIAASCDFVVATRDARFGLPELTVGVMGGARHLARLAPQPLVRRRSPVNVERSAAPCCAHGLLQSYRGPIGQDYFEPHRDDGYQERIRIRASVYGTDERTSRLQGGVGCLSGEAFRELQAALGLTAPHEILTRLGSDPV